MTPGRSQRPLAILGGAPAFDTMLHVGRPNVGDRARVLQRVEAILRRRWFTNHGESVQELERKLSTYLGVKHCIAVVNATIGLELVLRALGLSGEVIVPSFTFVASAHAVKWVGLTPIFCEVDPRTHLIDPDDVARRVTASTSAILGVHLWGRICPIEQLEAVAHRHGLRVVYDAAHAFACGRRGAGREQRVGGFGDAEVFSFHATKFVNSFEGGAITTNNDELARKLRCALNFGFESYDCVVELGTNGKMTEVCAAMGLSSFEALDELLATNEERYRWYRANLADVPGIAVLEPLEGQRSNHQYVVLDVDASACGLTRDQLAVTLHAENVFARRYFYPGCHRMPAYRELGLSLPVTEGLSERLLCLPTGQTLREGDLATIATIVREAVARAPEVRKRLGDAPVPGLFVV